MKLDEFISGTVGGNLQILLNNIGENFMFLWSTVCLQLSQPKLSNGVFYHQNESDKKL